ncbi:MAG: ACT domain-containing protein [Acidobacteriota bacterium]|nr:ACT domain-containing protein [Acidobacteriota bacterium]
MTPATKHALTISVLPKLFSICKLAADTPVPPWAKGGGFLSITRTDAELSIVAEADVVPADLRPDIDWRVLKVHGPFDLSAVGVLTSLVAPLAHEGISIFTISTFDTDYLLIQSGQLQAAEAALRDAGHSIVTTERIS